MGIKALFRKKSITAIRDASSRSKLVKTLGLFDMIAIGIGAIIGVGIFVVTGIHAANTAGPAVTISFALAGLTCIFVAFVFTEIASIIPSSGGSYIYAYTALGELPAWIVGWLIIMQVFCTCITVAVGWSGYVMGILNQLGTFLPTYLTQGPFGPLEGGLVNLPAVAITALLTAVLYTGIKESSRLNIVLMFVKIAAILIFIFAAVPEVNLQANWQNFMPYGFEGVALAAGSLFIAYVGFEVIANAAEESKNPKRDVPLSIICAVGISAVLYVSVAAVLTGMVPYLDLNNAEPLTHALKAKGKNIVAALVAAGGISGMTTVILFNMYAITRVLMAMSRDGLMPKLFAKIHPKHHTPHVTTIFVGTIITIAAAFLDSKLTGNLSSISMLTVLMIVVLSTVIFRRSHPNVPRTFKCPAIYFMALISWAACGYLIYHLFTTVAYVYALWLALGIAIYFIYMRHNATRIYKA
jgi:APA family basic amino acid/polyamine antiporter